MKHFNILLLVLVLVYSCKNETNDSVDTMTPKKDLLAELYTVMQGSYNSEIQSEVDSSYYNISLHMYPIWEGKGNYLYVEQALNSTQDKPYRQRIYKLAQLTDSTFTSEIYTLAVDSLWIGKWKTPKAFDSISPQDITLKQGCEVILKRLAKNLYEGKTGDTTCESTMNGAAFARSKVDIVEDKIISWDRGFDANGDYVWGAEKGGYIFNKID